MNPMPKTLLACLSALLVAAALPAQQHPNLARGFDPTKVYQLESLDDVNLLNGNVSIQLPIGPRYPVGGSFSYQLQLTYNAKVWDWEELPWDGALHSEALPNRLSNAGLGWTLSLGQLLDNDDPENNYSPTSWVYISPDGADHLFYDRLHAADNELATDPNNLYTYTRDGSYLRMRAVTTSSRTIEHPDGTIHTFSRIADPVVAGKYRWRLTQIRDRFSNAVSISYSADSRVWTLSDSQSRTHTVTFEANTAGFYANRLKSVALAGFGTSTSTYQFLYNSTPISINKPCRQTFPLRRTVAVPFLQEIRLPDGSSFKPAYPVPPSTPDACDATGVLRHITLPTGGRIEYVWSYWQLTVEGCSPREWYRYSLGLRERKLIDANGTQLGRWLYTPQLSAPATVSGGACDEPTQIYRAPSEELKVEVLTPENDKIVHYFSVWPGTDIGSYFGAFQTAENGLPFTRRVADATGNRFLSSEVFDCDASGANCGSAVRSTYVRYERDGLIGYCDPASGLIDCANTLQRLASERTVYHDDGGVWADVYFSDFDGFGHYRTRTTGGSFGAGDIKTAFTNYNPGVSQWPVTSPWVLGTYTESRVTEGGLIARSDFCFNASTGALLRSRAVKSLTGTPGGGDTVKLFVVNAQGNVTTEHAFGGDNQALAGTADLCALALPTSGSQYADQERVVSTYQYGVRATSTYTDANGVSSGTLAFLFLDQTIDRTGLVASSRDTAGVATTYEHDTMGRLVYVKPDEDAWEHYLYTVAAPGVPAKVEIRHEIANGATTLATRSVEFDGIGRLVRQTRKMPGGTITAKTHTYTGSGWPVLESEWQTGTPNKFTTHSDYDPFGRARKVEPADGAAHRIDFTYLGDRIVQRTTRVGTSRNPTTGVVIDADSITTQVYDRQGRLYRVREPARDLDAVQQTTYAYHPLDKLRLVTNNLNAQQRVFTYDGRGFLTSEQHPELGLSGNGTVSYEYDARGEVIRRTEGAVNGPRDLVFELDRAGRLTRIRERGGAARPLKEYAYSVENSASAGKVKGKLYLASRYNYVLPPGGTTEVNVTVHEIYFYAGRHGRISQRDTLTSSLTSYTQSFTWNELGQLASQTYPSCTHASCVASFQPPNRVVTYGYTEGYLTSVPGYATSLTYHPNGMLHRLTHANGVVDTYGLDPNGLQRPYTIAVTGIVPSTNNWSSGTHYFDGAGNLVRVGNDYYLYDKVSRLKTSAVQGGTHLQTYAYDTFGSIREINTQGTLQTFAVDSLTNRLQASATVAYDEGGNLTRWGSNTYTYDAFNQLKYHGSRIYLYTADDHRFYTLDWKGSWEASDESWVIRDLDGQLLREWLTHGNTTGGWFWGKDFIYRHGEILASDSLEPVGLRHMSLDHLGTPRVITNAAAARVGYHAYQGFGLEVTNPNQNNERMKFTGHERDANGAGTADDLDYMKARYYQISLARMMSVDPAPSDPLQPQSWNRYSYVISNPLRYNDPEGRNANPATGKRGIDPVPKNGETGAIRSNSSNPRVGQFGWSRNGGKTFHAGIDINAPVGTPILASKSGQVTLAPNAGKAGRQVIVHHNDGTKTTYSHLSGYPKGLKNKDQVQEGEIIGFAGRTGNVEAKQPASEDHVHFCVKCPNGQTTDPAAWLNHSTALAPPNRSEGRGVLHLNILFPSCQAIPIKDPCGNTVWVPPIVWFPL